MSDSTQSSSTVRPRTPDRQPGTPRWIVDPTRGMLARRFGIDWLDLLALATVFTASFAKIFWNPLGKMSLGNVLAILFVLAFTTRVVRRREGTLSRTLATAIGFVAAFAVVYLLGFFNLPNDFARIQFLKGMVIWVLQMLFMLTLAWHIVLRGRRMFVLVVGALLAGIVVNAAYGIVSLVLIKTTGINIDEYIVTPLTFGQGRDSGAHLLGAGIYRINGLMRDVNHLGVTAASGIVLTIAWLRGRWMWWTAGILFLGLVLTLSRSGALALMAGLAVLAVANRDRLVSRDVFAGIGVVAVAGIAFVAIFPELFNTLVASRLDTSGTSTRTHLFLYTLVPVMLEQHPFLGIGYNTFAVEFETLSGRDGFGPHSFYIQTISETGIVGFGLLIAFLAWIFMTLHRVTDRVALGLTAAIVATLAGNLFYLTAHLVILKVFYALAIAGPSVLPTTQRPSPDPVRSPNHGIDKDSLRSAAGSA